MKAIQQSVRNIWRLRWISLAISLGCLAPGCENKERVIDIKTPGANIEVDRTKDGVEIKTERTPDNVKEIDIDAPGAEIKIKKE